MHPPCFVAFIARCTRSLANSVNPASSLALYVCMYVCSAIILWNCTKAIDLGRWYMGRLFRHIRLVILFIIWNKLLPTTFDFPHRSPYTHSFHIFYFCTSNLIETKEIWCAWIEYIYMYKYNALLFAWTCAEGSLSFLRCTAAAATGSVSLTSSEHANKINKLFFGLCAYVLVPAMWQRFVYKMYFITEFWWIILCAYIALKWFVR